ncbi:MAG TPA: NepR family anti-sigma factor [Novosphingobium sp.]|nr:NepR family anti-sigma factor [Novosphingobium sp.]
MPPDTRKSGAPGWAKGLKNMYDSVVNEPLPDSFEDLLKKLDESKDD